jgi:hypothetical protein
VPGPLSRALETTILFPTSPDGLVVGTGDRALGDGLDVQAAGVRTVRRRGTR